MDVLNKKVTVLGAARSGVAVARMLAEHGAHVFVSDNGAADKKNMEVLQQQEIGFEYGQHSEKVFDTDFVVLSPGIAVASDIVQDLYKKRIPVYSEVEAAFWFSKSFIIGVTGSNGKTTTVTLIGEMLKQKDPQAIVAGNIGQAFSEYIPDAVKGRWAVIELSSFQLETIDRFKPKIAVVLNFAPNHLDRYDSYEHYLKAKWRITKNLQEDDLLIYNKDDEKLSAWAKDLNVRKQSFSISSKNENGAGYDGKTIFLFGEKVIDVSDVLLKGNHNYMNIMAAILAVRAARINEKYMTRVLKEFQGVEHRLEKVTEIHGVLYVNDSKATTVESLMYALQSYKNPIVLIAGGKDKGSDFSRLNDLIKEHVKAIVLIGTAAAEMKKQWQNIKPLEFAEFMEDAVRKASIMSEKDDVVLLSPACASFDMFDNYEHRGQQFKLFVHRLKESV
jgi:UDP-N-acetylmuramoylalanine--D-glutamate ligase